MWGPVYVYPRPLSSPRLLLHVPAQVICAVSTLALTLTNPFSSAQRDKHGCDALCLGSMTSARSALGLVGGVAVGKFSDACGRRAAVLVGLAAGLAGTVVFGLVDSLEGLWLSMIPSALFSHQFLVLKVTRLCKKKKEFYHRSTPLERDPP